MAEHGPDCEGCKEAVLAACRQMGCTCEPAITLLPRPAEGLNAADVGHHSTCTVTRRLFAATN